MKGSIIGWEISDYGGYRKIIEDIDDIRLPYEFNVESIAGFSYYLSKKLASIFLLKVNEYKLVERLFINGKKAKVHKVDVFVFDKKAKAGVLDSIIRKNDELSSLFRKFKNDIVKSNLSIDLFGSPTKKLQSDEGDKKSDKDSKEGLTVDEQEEIKQLFKEIKKYSSRSNTSDSLVSNTTLVVDIYRDDTDKNIIPKKEEILGKNLAKLLDINFEMDKDIINNLRFGKLDPAKIAGVLSGDTHIYNKVIENQKTRPFSVCILLDESGSMDDHIYDYTRDHMSRDSKLNIQEKVLNILYTCFSNLMPISNIYIYGHTTEQAGRYNREKLLLKVYNEKLNPYFESAFKNNYASSTYNNLDGPAINEVYKRVRNQTDDNVLFISISDGEPAGIDYGGQSAVAELKSIIELCRRDRFVTVGLGIGHNVSDIYNYSFNIHSYEDAVSSISRLINRVVKTEFKS